MLQTQQFKRAFLAMGFSGLMGVMGVVGAHAADDIHPFVSNLQQASEGMSLWQMLLNGGFIMLVLLVMSIVAMASVIYNFMMLKVSKIAPEDFTTQVIRRLEEGKETTVKRMCQTKKNVIAHIVLAGLSKRKRSAMLAREAMENCMRKELGLLWQNISYLADIASIAPLVGLLGTVLGMIQAFNVIAFQTGVVKPILLAGGVSKAMVTTAGGLIVAIPVMLFYSYFRGRVQDIVSAVESYSTDIIKLIEEGEML